MPPDAGHTPAASPAPAAQAARAEDAGSGSSDTPLDSGDAGPGDAGGASTHVDAGESARTDSISLAYAALTRGDHGAIDARLAALEADRKAHPDEVYATFYTGLLSLWKLSEAAIGVADLVRSPSLVDLVLGRLGEARTRMPNDFRVPGFLGLAQVNAGRLSADQALVNKGLATLQEAIVQFPAYGHFLRAASTSGNAKDDPLFSQALDDLAALTKECGFEQGDAETAFRYPRDPTHAPSPDVCLDEGIVPHVWEGVFMLYGDLALKAAWSTPKVRALYRSAQTAPAFARWPFAPVLEQRIAQAEEGARLHADTNPLNDPGIWTASGHICTGCHQEH